MNAKILITTLTYTEGTTTDKVYNAQRVLFALKRLYHKSEFNNYIVRSAIRRQRKFVERLLKEYD